jgi:hypothetical protein
VDPPGVLNAAAFLLVSRVVIIGVVSRANLPKVARAFRLDISSQVSRVVFSSLLTSLFVLPVWISFIVLLSSVFGLSVAPALEYTIVGVLAGYMWYLKK